jgi:hypothetical protein
MRNEEVSLEKLWEAVRTDFAPDGALRDIYISDTSLADWRALFAIIASGEWSARLYVDGAPTGGPLQDLGVLFRTNAQRLLEVDLGGIVLNSHFFRESEIELDCDPRSIADLERFRLLTNFLRATGDGLEKDLHITHEGMRGALILSYNARRRSFLAGPRP